MEPLIIDTIIEKVDASVNRLDEQEKFITEISQKVAIISDNSKAVINVVELVKKFQENINFIRWPVKEMTEMSNRLAATNELLSNPRKTKQVIFHTAGRLLWVVIGLSVGMVFLIMGWVNTINKLDQFRMHDVMWRYVKLTNQSQNLEYLQWIEEMYSNDPEKMKSFVEKEELRLKHLVEFTINKFRESTAHPDSIIDTTIHSLRKKDFRLRAKANR